MRVAICCFGSGSSCFPFNLFGNWGLGDGWSGLTGERVFFWGGTSDGTGFDGLAFDLAEVFFVASVTFSFREKKTCGFVVNDPMKHLFWIQDCFGYQCQVSFSPEPGPSLDSLDAC